ncbi:MAG: hypothetical protein WA125_15370 [Desulfosporosinus sp.]
MKQEYISLDEVMSDLGNSISQDDIIIVQDADVFAMACCNKTNGA